MINIIVIIIIMQMRAPKAAFGCTQVQRFEGADLAKQTLILIEFNLIQFAFCNSNFFWFLWVSFRLGFGCNQKASDTFGITQLIN